MRSPSPARRPSTEHVRLAVDTPVEYLEADGRRVRGRLVHVDRSVEPASYTIRLPDGAEPEAAEPTEEAQFLGAQGGCAQVRSATVSRVPGLATVQYKCATQPPWLSVCAQVVFNTSYTSTRVVLSLSGVLGPEMAKGQLDTKTCQHYILHGHVPRLPAIDGAVVVHK